MGSQVGEASVSERFLSLFLVILLITLVPTACQAIAPLSNATLEPDTEAAPESDIVTLTFACPRSYRAAMEELASEFHTLNPGISVRVVAIDDLPDSDAFSSNALLPPSAYSIAFYVDTAMWTVIPQGVGAGLYQDLSPFIEVDEAFMPGDFFPHTLEACSQHGKTYGLPTQIVLTVMFYNKRAFDEASIPYPPADWTLDDFLTLAQHLTVWEGNSVSQYGFVDAALVGQDLFIWSRVGDVVDDTGKPQLESPELSEAIQWYTDLTLKHGVMPYLYDISRSQEQTNIVRTGGAAMWTDTLANYAYYPKDLDIGIAPLPIAVPGSDKHYPGRKFDYFISAGTLHPQESWRWLRFLTYHIPAGHCQDCLPVRRSVAEDTQFWSRFGPEQLSTVKQVAEHLDFSYSTGMALYVYQAVAGVLEGESVATALRQAQRAAEQDEAPYTQAIPWAVTVKPLSGSESDGRSQVLFATTDGGPSLQELVADFNDGQAEFEVKLVPAGEQATADCFQGPRSVDFATVRSELLSLQPQLEADSSFSLTDFPDRFLEAYRYQGGLWGIPVQAQVRVIYYNRALFDVLDLIHPEVGWTTTDFQERALALHQAGYYSYLPLDGEVIDLVAWLTLLGAYPWNADGQPRFDAPDVVAATTQYAQYLAQQPDGTPYRLIPTMEDREDRLSLVRKGLVGMWSDDSGVRPSSELGLPDSSIGLIPLPTGTHMVSDLVYEGLFIAANSDQVVPCWEWMKYLSSHYMPTRGVPARNTILTSSSFAAQVGDETWHTYSALLEAVDIRTIYAPDVRAEQAPYLLDALVKVLQGTSTAHALTTAQQFAAATQPESR